jgi:hypothetical protein
MITGQWDASCKFRGLGSSKPGAQLGTGKVVHECQDPKMLPNPLGTANPVSNALAQLQVRQ